MHDLSLQNISSGMCLPPNNRAGVTNGVLIYHKTSHHPFFLHHFHPLHALFPPNHFHPHQKLFTFSSLASIHIIHFFSLTSTHCFLITSLHFSTFTPSLPHPHPIYYSFHSILSTFSQSLPSTISAIQFCNTSIQLFYCLPLPSVFSSMGSTSSPSLLSTFFVTPIHCFFNHFYSLFSTSSNYAMHFFLITPRSLFPFIIPSIQYFRPPFFTTSFHAKYFFSITPSIVPASFSPTSSTTSLHSINFFSISSITSYTWSPSISSTPSSYF